MNTGHIGAWKNSPIVAVLIVAPTEVKVCHGQRSIYIVVAHNLCQSPQKWRAISLPGVD